LLLDNGILSYITSNKYTRANYGKEIRKFLLEKTKILEYIDFNGVKVFENATVDTSILTFEKAIPEKDHKLWYCDVNEKFKKDEDLEKYIRENGFWYLQSNLSVESFSFLSDVELKIKEKIEKTGKKLKDWDIEIKF
jgi:type II restriction/modification system DNA methylase subunit YeeA